MENVITLGKLIGLLFCHPSFENSKRQGSPCNGNIFLVIHKERARFISMYVCVYVCMCACMYVLSCMYICMHVHVWMYACLYVCIMCVCMYDITTYLTHLLSRHEL